jgi:hypothetical protein
MFEINASTRLKATQQAPTVPGRNTALEDHTGKALLAAEDGKGIIAPAESYKKKNEHELEHEQRRQEGLEDKEARSPTTDMEKTSVSDMTAASIMASAATRLKNTR